MGKTKRKVPQGNNSSVQKPQPGLTAGEEKGQVLLTFAVCGRETWRARRSEGEHNVLTEKIDNFRVKEHRKIIYFKKYTPKPPRLLFRNNLTDLRNVNC